MRGPSSSPIRIRCHWPRTTSPPLTCSATLQDGSALPTWLQFDAATRTFSGTPGPADESIDVKVTATDSHNASVSDTFTLTLPPHNHAPVLINAASVGEVLTKTQAIASLATALVLDGHLGFGADPNIANATTIPHVSIAAAGSGTLDYYRFTVTAGSRGIFDIDQVRPTGENVFDVAALLAIIGWTLVALLITAILRIFDRSATSTA